MCIQPRRAILNRIALRGFFCVKKNPVFLKFMLRRFVIYLGAMIAERSGDLSPEWGAQSNLLIFNLRIVCREIHFSGYRQDSFTSTKYTAKRMPLST